MKDILEKHKEEVKRFCEDNYISKLALFGSYLKNTQQKESDLDLLIEFKKGTRVGLLDISRMENELSKLLNIKVDLRTPKELSKYFRDSVIKEAQIKYESTR